MPDSGNFQHLIDYLFELDICKSNGMGLFPLGFDDLINWQKLTGVVLNSWESSALVKLSRHYVTQFNKFDRKNEPDPVAILNPNSQVSSQLKNALRSMRIDYGG
jgi:hypothetical protein